MQTNKRVGLIVITTSVTLAAAAILLSTEWKSGIDFLTLLAYFLRIQLFDELIDVPTKFVLLGCLLLLAVGFLLYVGALGTFTSRPDQGNTE